MKSDLIKLLDLCMDEVDTPPDMSAVSIVAATTGKPIALMCELVHLLWLSSEAPEDFDKAVCALYDS